jgi:hypothetical protein
MDQRMQIILIVFFKITLVTIIISLHNLVHMQVHGEHIEQVHYDIFPKHTYRIEMLELHHGRMTSSLLHLDMSIILDILISALH